MEAFIAQKSLGSFWLWQTWILFGFSIWENLNNRSIIILTFHLPNIPKSFKMDFSGRIFYYLEKNQEEIENAAKFYNCETWFKMTRFKKKNDSS